MAFLHPFSVEPDCGDGARIGQNSDRYVMRGHLQLTQ
jgi:hypothetical protein